MKKSSWLVAGLLLAQGAAGSNIPLDASGNPVALPAGTRYPPLAGLPVQGCKCEDGRVFHLHDKLLDLNDSNARWEITAIMATDDFSKVSYEPGHENDPIPLQCDFSTNGTTFDTTALASYADYKLQTSAYIWAERIDPCAKNRYVADPRVVRKYEYRPDSGDQLIIGRDDPDAAVGKRIETDNKEVELSSDIIQRMNSQERQAGLPTMFPRKGEVVVANRELKVVDPSGKKHKVPAGTLGIVSKREEGSIEVSLYYSKNPNVFQEVAGLRMTFPCRFGEWCPTLKHPPAKRLSFAGDIKEGDFIGGYEFLAVMEEAKKEEAKKQAAAKAAHP